MRSNCEDPLKLSVFVVLQSGIWKSPTGNYQAILEAGHIPDGMELMAAAAQPTLKTIADKLRFCDVHVVCLAQATERYWRTKESALRVGVTSRAEMPSDP